MKSEKDGEVKTQQTMKKKSLIISQTTHLWVIYTLLTLSFALHSFTISNGLFREKATVISHPHRSKRQAKEDVKDQLDYSGANVEFIHPKVRDSMDPDEIGPDGNPWVWLTSYSRIPVS